MLALEKNHAITVHHHFSPDGGIGRRARLKIWFLREYGFDPHSGYFEAALNFQGRFFLFEGLTAVARFASRSVMSAFGLGTTPILGILKRL